MVYYFKFTAHPAESNRYHGRTGYGEADIFVSGPDDHPDLDALEQIARSYVTAQAWVADDLLEIHETNPPAPDWDRELTELYRVALAFGISGFFVASPDGDVPGGPSMVLPPK